MKRLRWLVMMAAMVATGWANSVDLSGPQGVLGYASSRGHAIYQINYQRLDAGDGIKLPFRYVFDSDPKAGMGWDVPLLTSKATEFNPLGRYGYFEVKLICGKKLHFQFIPNYNEVNGKMFMTPVAFSDDGQWRAQITGVPTSQAAEEYPAPHNNFTLTITRWDGWSLYFANGGYLQTVTTDTGKIIRWNYNGSNQVTTITVPATNTTLLTTTYVSNKLTEVSVNGDLYKPQTNYNGQLEEVTRPDNTKDTFSYVNFSAANLSSYANTCNPSGGNASMEHTNRYGAKLKLTWEPRNHFLVSDGPWTYAVTAPARWVINSSSTVTEYDYGAPGVKRTRTATGEWEEIVFQGDRDSTRTIRGVDGSETRITELKTFGLTYGKTAKVERKIGGNWVRTSLAAYDQTTGRLLRVTDAYNKDTVYTYTNHPANVLPQPSGWTGISISNYAPPKTKTVTDATGRWKTFEYDPRGNLVKFNNGANVIRSYEYDSRDRRKKVKNNAGVVVAQYDYNNNNHVTSFKDVNLNETTFEYLNRYGRSYLTKVTSPTLLVAEFTYDGKGNRLTSKGPNGETWTYTPTTDNLLEKITDPLNRETEFTYDGRKNLATVTNALDDSASIEYDDLDLANKVTDALGEISNYKSYASGKTQEISDNRSKVYKFGSNVEGTSESKTFPDNTTASADYNLIGRLTKKTFRGGSYVDISYDDAGRFKTATQSGSGGTSNVTYNAAGRLSTVSNPITNTGTEDYDYDTEGRLQKITYGSAGYTSFTYYSDGRLKELTYPTGMVVKYEYDAEGRTKKIFKDGVLFLNYTYDTSGRVETKDFGATGAIRESFSYGPLNRLTYFRVTRGSPTLWSAFYSYDSLYRRISSLYGHQGWKGDAYKYDAIGQVVGFKRAADNVSAGYDLATNELARDTFTYDPAGNRSTWARLGGSTVGYTANDLNQYSAVTNDTPPTYDSRGNISGRGLDTFEYDALGHLVTYKNNGATICTYAFDGLGRRVRKYKSGTDYEGHYSVGSRLLWVNKVNGTTTTNQTFIYEPGIDRPVAQIDTTGSTTQVHYVHRDVLNNVVALTNDAGLVQNYDYDVFGNCSTGNAAPAISRFLFTGRESDPETGTYYYRARNYSPQYGRFMQLDPIGFAGGDLNLYRYCVNNPINFIDPSGATWAEPSEYDQTQGNWDNDGEFNATDDDDHHDSDGDGYDADDCDGPTNPGSGDLPDSPGGGDPLNPGENPLFDPANVYYAPQGPLAPLVSLGGGPSTADLVMAVMPVGVQAKIVGRAAEFLGGQITQSGFLRAATKFLGAGSREVSAGRHLSADGMRQVRFGAHETRGKLHAHFEAYNYSGGKVIENTRVDIVP